MALVITVLNIIAGIWIVSIIGLLALACYHWVTGKPMSMDYDEDHN